VKKDGMESWGNQQSAVQTGGDPTPADSRKHGEASIELKARSQQYLTPDEEKALVKFLLLMSSFRHPVWIKSIPSLAFSIARQRSTATKPIKLPGKNWAQTFEKRHKELKARKVRAIDWKRHENNIYLKIAEWFEVIRKGAAGSCCAARERSQHGQDRSHVEQTWLHQGPGG
jgi:hypothetical protein